MNAHQGANVHPLIWKTVFVLDKINYYVAKVTSWLALPMMLSLICEVVMRYFFQKPTIWAMDIAIILFGIHFMLGSPYCLQTGNHIRTDFFYHNWSIKTRAKADIFNYILFFFPVHFIFFYVACKYFYKSFLQNEVAITSPWMPVIWPVKLAIPVCVGLTILQGISETIKCFYRLKHGNELWADNGDANMNNFL